MSASEVIGIATTGVRVNRTWMDAISDNVANINTVRPTSDAAFRERFVVAQAAGYSADGTAGIGDGAEVTGVKLGNPNGRLVYEPENPLADKDGMVRYPDIDLGDQMVQLIEAQRGYQANLAVIERGRDAYLRALQIGK